MGMNDYGFRQLGSFLKGDSPSPPNYMEFGAGSIAFTGSTNYLQSGFMRKEITWTWNGSNVKASTSLLTTDAVGSNIQELGMGVGASVGSTLYSRDLSAIGDKTSSFSVDISMEVRFNRP